MKMIKALLGIGFVCFVVYVCYLIVPVYYNAYTFQDDVASEARMNTYTQKSEQEIKENVIKRARALDLPIDPEKVTVRRGQNQVSISTEYQVHIDVPLHPMDVNFVASRQNKGL